MGSFKGAEEDQMVTQVIRAATVGWIHWGSPTLWTQVAGSRPVWLAANAGQDEQSCIRNPTTLEGQEVHRVGLRNLLGQLVKSSMACTDLVCTVYTHCIYRFILCIYMYIRCTYMYIRCTWVLLVICVYHFHVCPSVQPL